MGRPSRWTGRSSQPWKYEDASTLDADSCATRRARTESRITLVHGFDSVRVQNWRCKWLNLALRRRVLILTRNW